MFNVHVRRVTFGLGLEDLAQFSRQLVERERLGEEMHAGVEHAIVHDGVLGEAGHVQDPQTGTECPRLLRKLASVDVGHDDIGQHQVDARAVDEMGHGIFGVSGFEHRVAEVAQAGRREGQHIGIVLDEQDAFHSLELCGDRCLRRRPLGLAAVVAGEIDLDRRALPRLRVDLYVTAGLFDEAEHLRQAEARALTRILGGEKRIEGFRQHFRGHSGARIRDGDQHVLAGRDAGMKPRVAVVEMAIGRLDRQTAAFGHRISGVDAKIEYRVLELGRIRHGLPKTAAQDGFHSDGFAERA